MYVLSRIIRGAARRVFTVVAPLVFTALIAGATLAFAGPTYPTNGQDCAPDRLEVKTFDQNVSLTNQIAFTVNVS